MFCLHHRKMAQRFIATRSSADQVQVSYENRPLELILYAQ
ncbi:hypothetical protein MIZ03_3402 [Rhodoferax lithotrophicus]|uniref:Uncharacterized protein n=1 Tax=Rhodoferax lithotrophicus TaxID=2798804 RepID=A0ABM7MQE4_9BURK|nr:hypothetical protein MIZ03_3402 [Rhodoferax sp. MIZ03]